MRQGEEQERGAHGQALTRTGGITLGLLPVVALSAALTTPAHAQSVNVPLDPVTVQGGGGGSGAAQPAGEGEATPPAAQGGTEPGSFNVPAISSAAFTAPLVNTPQTVTVVPGTIIEQRGATDLTEVLRNTPGISFDAGENGFGTSTNNFKIRGFDSSGSVYVDGVRSSGSFARDTFNVEQVEVVKGAAADNGRGSGGGYVNMVTKTPQLGNFTKGEVSIGFDEYDSEMRARTTIDVNRSSGTVAVRVNGMIEDGGVAGRDIADANAWGLAPSIAFGLGTEFRAIFGYEHLRRNDLPDWGTWAHTIPGMWRHNGDLSIAHVSRDKFYGLRSDFDDTVGNRAFARFEYDVAPGITITNQTTWAEVDRAARFTMPTGYTASGLNVPPFGENTDFNTGRQYYDRVNTTIANQTNLQARFNFGGVKHTVSTGVEIMREESDALRFPGGAANTTTVDIFNPDPDRAIGPPSAPTQTNNISVDTVAGYLYDTIELRKWLLLTGGIRVEHYDINLNSALLDGTPAGVGQYEDSYTTLGGKAGIIFKPAENGSVYLSYGRATLPPGSYLSNPDISREGNNAFPGFVPGADPTVSDNYEIGTKWDFFGGRLSATAAAFHTTRSKVPYGGSANFPDIVYGKQVIQGLEFGLAGNLTERWKVFGGMTILDTERKHGADVDAAAQAAQASDYQVGGVGAADPAWQAANPTGVTTTNGDELAFTPNFFANLWMTYDITRRFTVGGGVQYVGDSWLGRPDDALRLIPNGKYGKLPDYFLVNLMASYDLTDYVTLRLNVDNVFDETYAVSTNWPGMRATLGDPRTYRISTSFKF